MRTHVRPWYQLENIQPGFGPIRICICAWVLLLLSTSIRPRAHAHDIPSARVDRSIQVTLQPGRLSIDYEVSLAELTLTRDLRNLVGVLPEGDRDDWFRQYGEVTSPLNAKGLLVSINQRPLPLRSKGYDLVVEEHPQLTFHYEADLPHAGHLKVQDTNYVSSEGSSRLAIRGLDGVHLKGDSLPGDVRLIDIQPIWLMSDLEERRSKQAETDFNTEATHSTSAQPKHDQDEGDKIPPMAPTRKKLATAKSSGKVGPIRPGSDSKRLTRLLETTELRMGLIGLVALAFGLGAAHAIQPGHGKTLVAATVVADRGSPLQGILLGLIATATHTGSVLLVALGLWLSRSTRYEAIHSTLTYCAGFLIAALGFWRIGRHLAGYQEHETSAIEQPDHAPPNGLRNLVGLGVAGGLVPCWDAVALVVLAEALGRLGLGILLLVAFGGGMALVLALVGWAVARFRRVARNTLHHQRMEQALGIAGSLILCAMGIYLLSLV